MTRKQIENLLKICKKKKNLKSLVNFLVIMQKCLEMYLKHT